MSDRVLTIPNILTALRICLVPFFVYAMNLKDFSLALKILVLAGITDSLDGLIARKFRQISKFGVFLDPLADKILLMTIVIVFYIENILPKWFVLIVFTRDVLVVFGWLECYLRKRKVLKPMILGKIYNATQVIAFTYILLSLNFNLPNLSDYLLILASLIAASSFVQYAITRINTKD